MKKFILLTGVLVFIAGFFSNVYAYIDPGTGSMLFQVIIASLLSAIFIFKSFFSRMILKIKSIFIKKIHNK